MGPTASKEGVAAMITDENSPDRPKTKVAFEDIKIEGDKLVAKIKEIVKEGNVRRIIIKNEEGKTLMEVPLTFGVVGALFAPSLAAIGAVAALVSNCTIRIERKTE
jgi:hypothetical protein